jgi:putative addiction module component (TIGR02574 family)
VISIDELRQLSVLERLALLEQIWESLEQDAVPELTETQRLEIDRRLEAYDASPESGRPWVEVKARLMG